MGFRNLVVYVVYFPFITSQPGFWRDSLVGACVCRFDVAGLLSIRGIFVEMFQIYVFQFNRSPPKTPYFQDTIQDALYTK